MIRITYRNIEHKEEKETIEVLAYTLWNGCIHYLIEDYDDENEYGKFDFLGESCIGLDRIIKVEKQVKDLTLDEINKLGVSGLILIENGIDENYVFYSDQGQKFTRTSRSYIDITSIVKNDIKYIQEQKQREEILKREVLKISDEILESLDIIKGENKE